MLVSKSELCTCEQLCCCLVEALPGKLAPFFWLYSTSSLPCCLLLFSTQSFKLIGNELVSNLQRKAPKKKLLLQELLLNVCFFSSFSPGKEGVKLWQVLGLQHRAGGGERPGCLGLILLRVPDECSVISSP